MGRGVVDVAGSDGGQAGQGGQLGENVVALVVGGLVTDGQLDRDVAGAEHVGERAQFLQGAGGDAPLERQRGGAGRGQGGGDQGGGDRALAAAGEDDPVAAVRVGQGGLVVDRAVLLASG